MNKIIAYTIMLLLIVGCATQKAYEGTEKSSEELSLIKPAFHGPVIRKVDKYYFNKLKGGGFETLPGKHTVMVSLNLGPNFGYQLTSPVKMVFVTEAGNKYVIDYIKGEYYVIEENSGNIIYKIKN